MRMTPPAIAALLALISSGIPSVFAMEQPAPAVAAAASPYSYADLADLAVAAPMAIHARIRKAAALKPEQAPGLAAGHVRFFIEADVVSLIRGSGPLAARISYLVDLPLAANGKAPKLKSKQPVLIFARPVASGTTTDTGSVRLVAPDAQEPPPLTRALIARACGFTSWDALLEGFAQSRQSVAEHWAAIVARSEGG